MELCHLCRNIPFHNLPPLPDAHNSGSLLRLGPPRLILIKPPLSNRGDHSEKFGFQHHQDLESLKKSALKCNLCALIYQEVELFIWDVHNAQRGGSNGRSHANEKPKRYRFQITHRGLDQDGFVVWTDGRKKDVWPVAGFGLCVEHDTDLLSTEFRGRIVETDASSSMSLQCATQWVQQCDHYHEECRPGITRAPLPSRVLDVGHSSSDTIRLWETRGASGSYTTLSYIWGKAPQFTTTAATLNARKEGIPFDALSKAMQDAVVITRRMGIQYLWVDAVCIIQGDATDWQRESGRMGDIYANSYLTISAAGGRDTSQGCFVPRPSRNYTEFDYTTQNGVTGQLSVYPVPVLRALRTLRFDYLKMESEPISERAWTLQERVLTCRTLFYASDQMYFECRKHFLSEDGVLLEGRHFSVDMDTIKLVNARTQTANGKGMDTRELWDTVLNAYTPRNLTNPTDKLPAFSGMAARFEKIFDDKYLAGLWERRLIGDLLWTGGKGGAWPPPRYRAPSWSWAAVDHSQSPMTRYRQCKKLATILASDVTISGLNPFGEVSDGRITLRAPLIRVFVDPDPQKRWSKGVFGFTTHAGKSMKYTTSIAYDIDYETLQTLQLFAVLIGRDTLASPVILYPSLLVTPASGKGKDHYSRLAMFLVDEDALGDEKPNFNDQYPTFTLV
ncbi:heterokaryon incompatibility protein-domain-containing protein [Flammula alnicola]|nr:heterokaryon incompatibility protein-domain-containing protein [Flammula alnicola]